MADQSKWHDIKRESWQHFKSTIKHTSQWAYYKDYVYDDVTGTVVHQDRIKAREQAPQASVETQPPTRKEPAKGALGELCGRQQAAVIGQAVPIVFARRVGDRGGVMTTPPATDARYENDASNELTANYHLILGDGPMGSVQVRDVYQCTCRIGSFTQTYNRRAGDWDPGNFLVERVGYTLQNVPDYCGSKGTCEGLSTMSYENTYPDGSGDWALEVQVFIREGRTVTRLADSVSGPSSNFADLFKLAMEVSAKLPADMIDTTRLQTAALFLDANELYCDINLKEVQSLDDFIASNAPYFLVRETRVNGKRGLRPLLPIDGAYAIDTDPIPWEFEFNEDFIIPGSIQIDYIPLEQRKPKLMTAMWRQQPNDTFGVIRTAEVGYAGDRDSGDIEQHDMSLFCTHELHAVRAMAYKRARQKWSTHTISWSCRPEVYNRILEEGDIVRLTFTRVANDGSVTTHDYLYELDQIEKTSTGEVNFQATHFPVDAEGRSLVALTVMQAEAQGFSYEGDIRTGINCDENDSTDTSVPPEVGQTVTAGDPPSPPSVPPLLPSPFPSAADEEPGGSPPPAVPPAPIPTAPDDEEDPCEPVCTSGSICGEVGEPAPTCPAGTTQVGFITAHQPDGDQTCVICETCVASDDPSCPPPPPVNGVGVWYVESTAIDRGTTYNEYRAVQIPEPYVDGSGQLRETRIVSTATTPEDYIGVSPTGQVDFTPNDGQTVFFTARNRTLDAKDNAYWDGCNTGNRSGSSTSGALLVRDYADGVAVSSGSEISALRTLQINCTYRSASETTTLTYIGPGTINDWYSGSVSFTCNNYGGSRVCFSTTPFSPDLPGPS
jgi:hypothetical protein